MAMIKAKKNFKFNPDYEVIHIPGDNMILDKLLNHSPSCIHIYNYLCLRAKKSKMLEDKEIDFTNEVGIIRKINTRKISVSLDIDMRVVQLALKKMVRSGLINIINNYNNRANDKDIYISGYQDMYYHNNYIKLDGETVFSEVFLKAPKSHISLYITTYISNFKQALANLKRAQENNGNQKNFELIDKISVEKDFKEDTLLRKIKRVSKKDLKDALEGIKGFGIEFTESISISNPKLKKYIISAYSNIKKLFKPFNDALSLREKYPLSFSIVKDCISYSGINDNFTNKEYDDLVQMHNQYDSISLLGGLLKYRNYIDNLSKEIENKGGVIRECIKTFINSCSDKLATAPV